MKRSMAWRLAIGIMIALAILAVLLPFVWTLLTSLKQFKDIMSGRLAFEPTLKNYEALFFERGTDFPRYTRNTVIIGVSATFICIFAGSCAAYALSRFRFPAHLDKLLLGWTLILHMIHPMALVLPVFMLMRTIGLYNTHLGLILIYATIWMPVAIWMMKGFVDEVPRELEESAHIDGCSTFGTLRRIVFPLVTPGLAATTIFVFIFIWNEFLYALILTSSARVMTLPPGMARLAQQYFIRYGEMSSAAFFSTIPVLIFVLFVQRQIIRGLTFGAIKG